MSIDEKCLELMDLFRSDQNLESTCPRITSVYRLRAEDVVGSDENLFKMNYVSVLSNCRKSVGVWVWVCPM